MTRNEEIRERVRAMREMNTRWQITLDSVVPYIFGAAIVIGIVGTLGIAWVAAVVVAHN